MLKYKYTNTHDVVYQEMSNQVCNKYYLFNHDCCYAQVLLIHLCYIRMSSNVQRYIVSKLHVHSSTSNAHVSLIVRHVCKTFCTPKIIYTYLQLSIYVNYVTFFTKTNYQYISQHLFIV